MKGIVRATLFVGAFVIEPLPEGNHMYRVTYLIHADFGGKLPGFAIKMVETKQPMLLSKIKKRFEGS